MPGFNDIGKDAGDESFGYSDQKLERSIRSFQHEKGLKEDGVVHPGGETEEALGRSFFERRLGVALKPHCKPNVTKAPTPSRKSRAPIPQRKPERGDNFDFEEFKEVTEESLENLKDGAKLIWDIIKRRNPWSFLIDQSKKQLDEAINGPRGVT